MTAEERKKKIKTAVAAAVAHPMMPRVVAEGIAALAEEVDLLRGACIVLTGEVQKLLENKK